MNDKNECMPPYIYDTPVGVIQKEGEFFRGMATRDKNRPMIIRVIAVLFALLFFIIPGLVVSLFTIALFISEPSYFVILPALFSILWLSAGSVTIYSNIRS